MPPYQGDPDHPVHPDHHERTSALWAAYLAIFHLNEPGSEVDHRRDTVALFPPLALALAYSFEDIEILILLKN